MHRKNSMPSFLWSSELTGRWRLLTCAWSSHPECSLWCSYHGFFAAYAPTICYNGSVPADWISLLAFQKPRGQEKVVDKKSLENSRGAWRELWVLPLTFSPQQHGERSLVAEAFIAPVDLASWISNLNLEIWSRKKKKHEPCVGTCGCQADRWCYCLFLGRTNGKQQGFLQYSASASFNSPMFSFPSGCLSLFPSPYTICKIWQRLLCLTCLPPVFTLI